MSDAALSVTQQRVEQFAEAYLEACGCSVRERAGELVVTVPAEASTDVLATGTTTLVRSADPERVGDEPALHPESETFRDLLGEAAERAPVGRVELAESETEIRLPAWLVESDVSVASTRFVPYYDRTAIVGLFRIGIETVSEYQTELLRAGAVDTKSMEQLPSLADRLLTHSSPGSTPFDATTPTVDERTAGSAIDTLSAHVVEGAQSTIAETRAGAARAAGAELEEYRQLQDQRIDALEAELANVAEEIEELSTAIEGIESRTERLETLQERKELTAERDERQRELDALLDARSAGFPEKRQEIADRHSLDVDVTPVALTEYRYEQGELETTIVDAAARTEIRVGYGDGVGVTETRSCTQCGATLTGENPLRLDGETICCASCRA